MKQPESDQQNQQKCKKCGKIVGYDYQGRKHKYGCNPKRIHTPINGVPYPDYSS